MELKDWKGTQNLGPEKYQLESNKCEDHPRNMLKNLFCVHSISEIQLIRPAVCSAQFFDGHVFLQTPRGHFRRTNLTNPQEHLSSLSLIVNTNIEISDGNVDPNYMSFRINRLLITMRSEILESFHLAK